MSIAQPDLPRPLLAGRFLVRVAALVLLAVDWSGGPDSAVADSRADSPKRPNIVLVLADDLGYGDLACYGHPVVQTPNLDRLAKDGLRLTTCYSAGANCSPSRTGLMTGRTPYRVGVHNQIPFLSPMHVRAHEKTIATLLRDAGYATCHSGKWHLNGMFNLPGQPTPHDHGFDHSFGTQNNCLPNHENPYNFVRNGIPTGPLEGFAAQLVADEAIRWLREARDAAKPFFLYVCFHEPHEPIRTDPQFAKLYDYPDDPSRRAYYGNIMQLDHAFGRLMQTLDDLGLRDDTLVWFTSDNGPARTKWHNAGSSGPLREYKGHVYEGGIRVPGIVRWPAKVKAGRESDAPICGTDFLPTVCAMAGIAAPTDRTLDGESVLPLLAGDAFRRAKPLYWQFNYAQSEPKVALRNGDWKIVARLTELPQSRSAIDDASNHALKHAEATGFELYNLRHDLGETNDRATAEPVKLNELRAALVTRFREVQAETPTWPAFQDPGYEAARIAWPTYLAPARGPSSSR
jgi:arylsulfatase A